MRGRSDADKKPWQLIVAEIFLVFILVNYFTKMCVIAAGMSVEDTTHLVSRNLFIFFIEILMFFVTADAMLGIASRKPKGWKKAVRGCMLLLIFTVIGWININYGTPTTASTLVTFNPVIIAPVVVVVYLLMLVPKVRNYYVPPMEEEKSLMAWIKFSFAKELYPSGKYRVKFDDE